MNDIRYIRQLFAENHAILKTRTGFVDNYRQNFDVHRLNSNDAQ
jgi:hypothetical protein